MSALTRDEASRIVERASLSHASLADVFASLEPGPKTAAAAALLAKIDAARKPTDDATLNIALLDGTVRFSVPCAALPRDLHPITLCCTPPPPAEPLERAAPATPGAPSAAKLPASPASVSAPRTAPRSKRACDLASPQTRTSNPPKRARAPPPPTRSTSARKLRGLFDV